MTTVELKNILIHQIAGIDDKSFLPIIKKIIDTESGSIISKTAPELYKRINEGRKQIANGVFYNNDQFEMETEAWLKEE
jgi:hypothetical protein